MTDLIYLWPPAAKFGRRVPKEKFYKYGNVNTAVHDKFVAEVASITWGYKLATATINLPEATEVPEIQVFELTAKNVDVSEPVLSAIDKAIPTPIIFEITRNLGGESQTRMVAAHKQLSAAAQRGTSAPKISQYFTTGWMPEAAERQLLPTAISLPALYAALLEPLTGVRASSGEDMWEVADRLKAVGKLEREIASLERKLRTEKQLKRKVEIRRELKNRQSALAALN